MCVGWWLVLAPVFKKLHMKGSHDARLGCNPNEARYSRI